MATRSWKELETKKLLKNGKMHVDLLKIPHHGSQHNSTKKFFQQVTADIYVVSGDHVKFPKPHKDTMKWLADDARRWRLHDLLHVRVALHG